MKRRIRPILIAVLLSAFAVPPAAGAQAGALPAPDAAVEPAVTGPPGPGPSDGAPLAGPVLEPVVADAVLDEAEAALAGEAGAPETTLALQEVGALLPALGGEERRRGEALLLRPTDGKGDSEGDGYTRPHRVVASRHFCVFWVEDGRDAVPQGDTDSDTVPDYVEGIVSFAETSWRRQHGPLGWKVPRHDGHRGCRPAQDDGRKRTDIYAKDLGGDYGYASTDHRQRGHRRYSYLVVDNDMAEIPGYSDPLLPLSVTIAHEYNHVIQFSYDYLQDSWMFESTATALEEQVFPGVDDYLQYVSDVASLVSVPLTKADASLKIYGDAVFSLFLSKRHGARVLPRAWASSRKVKPKSFGLAAHDRGIRWSSEGETSFLPEFVRFAASLPEWRGSRLYPDSEAYPNVKRTATLRAGARSAERFRMDHTTYRLARVKVSGGRAVKLLARAPAGIGSGLALVGRLRSGRVVRAIKVLPQGGMGVLRLSRPARFERITAVIVNGHAGIRGYSKRASDWIYTGGDQEYRAAARRVG